MNDTLSPHANAESGTIPVAVFGLGPIGREVLQDLLRNETYRVVGAVDNHPKIAGRRLADICGECRDAEAKVYPSFAKLQAKVQPRALIHCAASDVTKALEQLLPAAELGLAMVSSCEELIYPQYRAPELATKMDAILKKSGGRLVAAGVNPGFVLDLLPLCLTGICRSLRSVRAHRRVDARTRRAPLLQKIGCGRDPKEFQEALSAGLAGHAGMRESLFLLAHGLGWTLGPYQETNFPVVAQETIETSLGTILPGQVCGIHQTIEAQTGNGRHLHLELEMYAGAQCPEDVIRLEGTPPLTVRVEKGTGGDDATVGALLQTLPRIVSAPPGLHLLHELPLPRWQEVTS